ncbi:MAG TPA: hypothetical protein DEA05_05615, partial [Rhodobacteraceae bacterium]|nr:hypothetical protein [Paracoccaceae bacterium]
MKTAEIEDVLSSIRRLVSEEGRAEGPRAAARPEPEGRLVLTPALRVAEPTDAEEAPGSEAPESGAGDEGQDTAPWTDPEATLYAAAEAAGATPDQLDSAEDDADRSDLPADRDEAEGFEARVESLNAHGEQAAPASDGEAEVSRQDARVSDADDGEGREDDPAALQVEAEDVGADRSEPAADDAQGATDDADGEAGDDPTDSDQTGPEADRPADEQSQGDGERVADAGATAVELPDKAFSGFDAGADFDDPPWSAEAEDTRPLSARIAELEQRIGEADGEWEPDGTEAEDFSAAGVETLQWQDHVDEDPESARPRKLDPRRYADLSDEDVPPEEDDLNILGSDETFLDEESLRELVADIVREELQGALGER